MLRRWLTKISWLLRGVCSALRRRMKVAEMASFMRARLDTGVRSLTVFGITFPDVDRVVWTHIFHIILLEEYSPPGFRIDRGDIVVDIGANRGVFVAYAVMSGAAKILAFEPSGISFQLLTRLINQNRFNQVEPYQKAVSADPGPVRLYLNSRHTRHSIVPPETGADLPQMEVEIVDTVSLDEIVEQVGQVDLLKMDCEGAEYQILMSASDRVFEGISKMVMEFHGSPQAVRLNELTDRLRRAGFDLTVVEDPFGDPYAMIFARSSR